MRNVFLFFRRFSTFFTFLFLQIFCLVIVFRFNKFHNAIGLTMANNVAGKLHQQSSKINGFFTLRQTADSLAKKNAELMNQKGQNWFVQDTSISEIADYIPLDTLGNIKKIVHFVYRPAQVLLQSNNSDKQNYMVLARGVNNGVRDDMAVVGAESKSVIGKVVYADANMSYVMTLLHPKSIVPAKIANNSENGVIRWDGNDNKIVSLERIAKTVAVKIGDSIVTNNTSDIFPENLMIGIVKNVKEDKNTGNWKIDVALSANMLHTNYVQIIENTQQKDLRNNINKANKVLGQQ